MTDRFTVRTVVVALAAGLIISVVGMLWLASTQTTIPDQVDRLAFLIGGAISGVLAKTSHDEPVETTVVNSPADALQGRGLPGRFRRLALADRHLERAHRRGLR